MRERGLRTTGLGAALTALAALLLTLGACGDDGATKPLGGTARTRVLLTDAPFPYDSVDRVDVYIERIAASATTDTTDEAAWVTIAEPRQAFNLLDVQQGTTAILGQREIPAGAYRAIRMVIDPARSDVHFRNGGSWNVAWGGTGSGTRTLHALVEPALNLPSGSSDIVIDFDVGRSFLCPGDACGATLFFSPVFRAVVRSATGSISGRVTGDTLSDAGTPIANTAIRIYQGNAAAANDSGWSLVATGKTDANGDYKVAFLLPGSYILRADAPRASVYTPGVRANVVVQAGVETAHQDIALPGAAVTSIGITGVPASYLVVGDTATVFAHALLSTGVASGEVSFTTSDASVVTVTATGVGKALVRAVGPGRATVAAHSGELVAAVQIPVRATAVDDDTPVAAVLVRADSGTTVMQGRTLLLYATPVDAVGAPLPNRTVSWTTSTPGVATVAAQPCGTICSTGVVTGVAVGGATITASAGGQSGSIFVNVAPAPPPVASITLSPPSRTIALRDSLATYTATLRDAGGTALSAAGRLIAWRTSDSTVARVYGAGLSGYVIALKPGSVTVSAETEGKSATSTLVVNP